jgi:hypothetical protein
MDLSANKAVPKKAKKNPTNNLGCSNFNMV